MTAPWLAAHDAAVARGEATYIDPASGYQVFSELGLLARGTCCGAGCRHCPYGHQAVPRPNPRAYAPTWAHQTDAAGGPVDVLLWSGGKDGYLAHLALQEAGRRVVWLSTHDARDGHVAHQEVHVGDLVAQAKALDIDHVSVPLSSETPYEASLTAGLDVVARRFDVQRVCTGDLHLTEIRDWREAVLEDWLTAHGAELHFPVWGVPYEELLDRLEASGVEVILAAVPDEPWPIGTVFDRAFFEGLPEGVDRFGECGEFQTYVKLCG